MFHKPADIIPFAEIIKNVCDTTGESPQRILTRTRKREVVFTRQLICFYAKFYSGISHKQIATGLGYKDHTTSVHGIQNIKDLIDSGDEYITGVVARINKQLKVNNDRPPTSRTPDGNR